MMRVFVEHILPKLDPALSVIWLRNPDSTQHTYGPGTPNVEDALRHQDHLLGELLGALDHLGRADSTDLLIASDHGHSSVASDPKAFPLRALQGEPDGTAKLGAVAAAGYVVSGDIRSVEWLRRAGFAHVYDGVRCVYDPVMAGVAASGQVLHETHDDPHCKTPERTSTGDYRAPHGALPSDAIVIAANGGSEYFYVPSHDLTLVQRLVSALQERRVYGPVFVRSVYGAVPGTLLLERIGMEQSASVSPPTPDVVVSFDWDDTATSAAAPKTPGREHSSPQGCRGMHGSFSPSDVHNTLIAFGPDFRPGYKDEYPSSNLDVAPTVAALFGLALPHAEGRVLTEALAQPSGGQDTYRVEAFEERVGPVPLKRTCGFDDLDCKRPQRGLSYGFSLSGHKLTSADGAQTYVYFDKGMATRAASSSSTRAQPTRSDGPK
jgi:arylsulfatase A-like enzyme